MRFLKYLALLALASVPLLLVEKSNQAARVGTSDDDDIFERDLRVE